MQVLLEFQREPANSVVNDDLTSTLAKDFEFGTIAGNAPSTVTLSFIPLLCGRYYLADLRRNSRLFVLLCGMGSVSL